MMLSRTLSSIQERRWMRAAPPTGIEDHDGRVESDFAVVQMKAVEFCRKVELMFKEVAHWHV